MPEAPRDETRPQTAGLSRVRAVVCAALVCGFLAVAVIAIMPIHATAVQRGPDTLADGVVAFPPGTEPAVLSARITVTEPGLVELRRPLMASGREVEARAVRGNGSFTPAADGFTAQAAGDTMTVRSWSETLYLQFVTQPGGGAVSVRTGESTLDVDLDGARGLRTVTVQSGVQRSVASARFQFQAHQFELPPDSRRIEVWYGLIPVDVTVDRSPAGDVVHVSRAAVLRAIGREAVDLLPLLLLAVVVAVLSLVIGWAVLGLLGGPGTAGFASPTVRFIVGLATPVTLLGMLHYVVSVRIALLAVAVLAVALLAVALPRSRHWPRHAASRAGIGTPAVTVAVISVMFTVVPALLTRRMNLGHLNTDIYDYFHLTRLFWKESVLGAGTDWGDGLRVVDSSWRSALEGVTGLTAGEVTLALRFLLSAAVPLGVAEAAGALGAGRWRRALAAALAAACSPLLALFVEGYLSRELFAALSILLLAAAVIMLARSTRAEATADTDRDDRGWGALGIAAALPAAIVPPYSTVVVAIAGSLFLRGVAARTERGWRRFGLALSRTRAMWWFIGGLAAVGLVNMVWVRNTAVAQSYAEGVNPIGLNLIVPFYDTGRYPGAILGLVPFHANREAFLGPTLGSWVPAPVREWNDAVDRLFGSYWPAVVGFIVLFAVAVALARVNWPDARKRSVLVLLGATAAVTVVGFAVSLTRWDSQSFFILMWGWTLAPILLVSLGLLALLPTARRRLGAIAIAVIVVVVAGNSMASIVEASRWLDHPYGNWSGSSHFDLTPDVATIRDRAEALARGHRRFRFTLPPSDIAGTDDDRVAINQIELILVNEGLRCEDCVEDRRNGAVWYTRRGPSTRPDLTVVIGSNRCAGGTERRVYTGRQLAVCAANSG